MKLIRATERDFPAVKRFYLDAIEKSETMSECCRWVYGLHPNDEMILGYIRANAFYFAEKDGTIALAFALTGSQEAFYRGISWQKDLADDEVAVIHIFAVNPDFARQGLAKWAITQCLGIAESLGKSALRLDALDTNKPAIALYDALGFTCVGSESRQTKNVGFAKFFFYEKLI